MKVTLIYSGIGIMGFGKTKLFPLNGELQWIQHGIASIGAYAKREGHEVDLIDMRTLNSWEHFENIITKIKGVDYKFLDTLKASIVPIRQRIIRLTINLLAKLGVRYLYRKSGLKYLWKKLEAMIK